MAKGRDAKPHIGIFGRRNVGKSSVINALTGQEVAIVSDVAGTTTDPVKKSIELPGIGPVILVDTAGIDDFGSLGGKRIEKTLQVLKIIDTAILVIEGNSFGEEERRLISEFKNLDVPFIVIHNKSDVNSLSKDLCEKIENETGSALIDYCAIKPKNNNQILHLLQHRLPVSSYQSKSLIGDLVKQGETVLLITPIDMEAPEGRLILPQIQVIRDILDNDCIAVVVKEREVDLVIKRLNPKPVLVITDSQVFLKADASVPKDIPLTSFSILLAHHKGDFTNYLKGTPHLGKLHDGDRILILESCTHHVSCDDIGRTKLPRWISNFSGKKLEFDVVAGLDKLPGEIHEYAMVIQCGGCMITQKQIFNRLKPVVDAGIPVSNYGMTIAWLQGIYERAVAPFVKVNADYL